MNYLSDIELRILAELDEAGQENPAALLNTVTARTGADCELIEFRDALLSLIQRGLVRMSLTRDSSKSLTESSMEQSITEAHALLSYPQFDLSLSVWTDNRTVGPPFRELFPYVIDTDAGARIAQDCLRQKGYQWWRQNRE